MDKQTTELLQQLAAKMGTTVEYLWSIMVKQAYITVVTDIICYILVGAFVFAVYKYVPKIWAKGDETKRSKGNTYDEPELKYYITCIALVAASSILSLISLISIPATVGILLNPEYWALKQILGIFQTK